MLGHGADERDYSLAARILEDLGVKSVRLMTNNPAKIAALQTEGVTVIARVPLEIAGNAESAGYLLTKAKRMDHLFLTKATVTPLSPVFSSKKAHESQSAN